LKNAAAGPSYAKRLAFKTVGRRYLRDRNPTLLRSYARQVQRQLAGSDSDVVLSPGSIPVAYLHADRPVAFWTDATFAGMVDYYAEFSDLPACTIREGMAAEQSALSLCTLAIYASEWAAKTAVDNYDVDPAKVRVVSFGANLTEAPTRVEVEQMVAARSRERCTMLLLGVDWARKGGDFATAVVRELNKAGLPTELRVAGVEPPAEALASTNVTALGFISKSTRAGRDRWTQLLGDAHFLIVPSRAECFGAVFAEAGAFGVPCLATDVGGIGSAVLNDVNGRRFDLDADVTVWRDYVLGLWADPDRYAAMAMASYREYAQRMNWATACSKVAEMLSDVCPGARPGRSEQWEARR
jgi:glycosyltransferase involved in cell wall biosynthesis